MDGNLFMMCARINRQAFSALPPGFSARSLRRDELGAWKAMPFDDATEARRQGGYMDDFFRRVYAAQADRFFADTQVIADRDDRMVATCLLWKAYGAYTTVHWFKVLKAFEGRGLGRALLSLLFNTVADADLPVYLHTQPGSFRAIKLYSDFGFSLLTDPRIGARDNDLAPSLPYLQAQMPGEDFARLRFARAPAAFIRGMERHPDPQF